TYKRNKKAIKTFYVTSNSNIKGIHCEGIQLSENITDQMMESSPSGSKSQQYLAEDMAREPRKPDALRKKTKMRENVPLLLE
uniref:Uncharacterized protein n=1 Tax=Peromyscus maniculatus bairdii TaxID=230844 RepID=A0A8C8UP91_PERMB